MQFLPSIARFAAFAALVVAPVLSGCASDSSGAHVFARRDNGTNIVSRLVPDGTDVATLKLVSTNIALALESKLDTSGGTVTGTLTFLGSPMDPAITSECSIELTDQARLSVYENTSHNDGAVADFSYDCIQHKPQDADDWFALRYPHASGVIALNADLLTKLASTSAAPAWVSGTNYTANALVTYNGVVYRCKADTVPPYTTTPDADAAHWEAKPVSDLFLPLTGGKMSGDLVFDNGVGDSQILIKDADGYPLRIDAQGILVGKWNDNENRYDYYRINWPAATDNGTVALAAPTVAAAGNLAALDAQGNPVDSGVTTNYVASLVPASRTVNSKPLTSDVRLTAADIPLSGTVSASAAGSGGLIGGGGSTTQPRTVAEALARKLSLSGGTLDKGAKISWDTGALLGGASYSISDAGVTREQPTTDGSWTKSWDSFAAAAATPTYDGDTANHVFVTSENGGDLSGWLGVNGSDANNLAHGPWNMARKGVVYIRAGNTSNSAAYVRVGVNGVPVEPGADGKPPSPLVGRTLTTFSVRYGSDVVFPVFLNKGDNLYIRVTSTNLTTLDFSVFYTD